MGTLTSFFAPLARYDGARPIHIWLLRLNYFLAFAFVGTSAWSALLGHQGPWDQYRSVAICIWAAYPTLMAIGLIHPLRMLPVMFFMIAYKTIWLSLVAYPMYEAGTLTPSAITMAKDFLWLPLALVAIPWGYAARTYLLPAKRSVV